MSLATNPVEPSNAGAREAPLAVVVLDDADRARALRPEWDALLGRTPAFSAALTFDYAMTGWDIASRSAGDRLAVITVRRAGELVCLWPLFVRREGAVTVARHLGFGGCEEYAGPLVPDDEDPAVVRAALAAARRLADILKVYNLPAVGLSARVLAEDPAFKHRSFVLSPVVSLAGVGDWDAWIMAASKKLRAALRQDRRRLSEKGQLSFRQMAGPVDGPRCIEWFFAQKRTWLAERRMRRSWMLDDEGRDFFAALVSNPPPAPGDRPVGVQACALMLDDQIIAACICFTSGDRLEFYNTTYDPAFRAWSPGGLIIQDCVTQAIARGLDFDFRITQQSYKARWADRGDRYDSFVFSGTPWGLAAVVATQVRAGLHALRVRLAPRIKALLKR